MSDFNPLVKQSAKKTLDAMIDVLQFNITLLSRFSPIDDEDMLKTWLTAADINGLCLMLDGLKNAAESCYAQCCQAQRQEEEAQDDE